MAWGSGQTRRLFLYSERICVERILINRRRVTKVCRGLGRTWHIYIGNDLVLKQRPPPSQLTHLKKDSISTNTRDKGRRRHFPRVSVPM